MLETWISMVKDLGDKVSRVSVKANTGISLSGDAVVFDYSGFVTLYP